MLYLPTQLAMLTHALSSALDATSATTAAAAVDPVSAATGALAASGPLGATVVILGVVVAFLWREAKQERTQLLDKIAEAQAKVAEIQQLRVTDAQAGQDRMLRVIEQATGVITAVNATMTETRGALTEVRDATREHTEELRGLSERIPPVRR